MGGTFRTTSTTTTEDSGGGTTTQVGGKRFLWNQYNRVDRASAVFDSTDSWSYPTGTIRQANGASGNKVEMVIGLGEDALSAACLATVYVGSNSARKSKAGIGVDSTTAFSGHVQGSYVTGTACFVTMAGSYRGSLAAGYHYLAWCEYGADGTATFVGDDGAAAGGGMQSGLSEVHPS